jgi:hypothetical protein
MADIVPPMAFQAVGTIIVVVGTVTALGTLAADHAYWQYLVRNPGNPLIPTNWLMMPIGERFTYLRDKQDDPRAERLRARARRWWIATGGLLAVATVYFAFVSPQEN